MSADLTLRIREDLDGHMFGKQAQGGVAVSGGDPSTVTGLRLWLKADAMVGNGDATSDGDPVAQWTDSSGQGNHATQSTSGWRPSYQTNEINSLPAVFFDGTDFIRHFVLPDFCSAFTAGEIFAVLRVITDPPATDTVSGLWNFGTHASQSTHYPYTDGTLYELFGTDVRKTMVNPTPPLTTWRLYNVRSAASDFEAYIDGTSIFNTSTNTVGFPTDPVLGRSFASGYFFDGLIAEVIMYNKALSSGERTTVKNYIAAKYALTIA